MLHTNVTICRNITKGGIPSTSPHRNTYKPVEKQSSFGEILRTMNANNNEELTL